MANDGWWLARSIGRIRNNIQGVAAVEFSIVAPILILMAVCLIDFGAGIYRKMQVQNAAHAGVQYAILHGFDSSQIASSVTNATSFAGIGASPAPQQFCGCPSMSGIGQTDCSAICADGSSPATYVTVSAQGTYDTLFSYPMVPHSFNLSAQSTVRIR